MNKKKKTSIDEKAIISAIVSKEEFGKRLRAVRDHLKMKQRDFARKVGTSPNVISEIENGKYKPGFDIIGKFASELNINLYYLFFGKGEMFFDIDDDMVSLSANKNLVPEAKEFLAKFFNSRGFQFQILGYYLRNMKDY